MCHLGILLFRVYGSGVGTGRLGLWIDSDNMYKDRIPDSMSADQ